MSDVKLFQTDNGGDITVERGVVELSNGLESTVYLSLFGGNEDDNGTPDSPDSWWGNIGEEQIDRTYRSETQHLLRALPTTSGNLRRIEEAVNRDLAWLIAAGVASSVSGSASVTGVNRVTITIDVEAVGPASRFKFVENWKASA